MKMKSMLAFAAVFSTMSVFANDVVTEASKVMIPESVLTIHNNACSRFAELEADAQASGYSLTESYQLPGSEYSPVGPKLYVLTCDMFAYNSEVRAYIVDSYSTTQVAVAEFTSKGDIVSTVSLSGAGFDPETNTLGTFSKGRGMGDCGASATYTYQAYEQKFALTEARLKDNCDGEDTEWPVIYKK